MKKLSLQQGFSLVEVLVAITLLLLIVTGPMKIITDANHSTSFASEQITAFYLAQEGLELAQKGRDDLMLKYFQNKINGTGGITNPWTQFKTNFNKCIANTCGLVISDTPAATVLIKDCSNQTSCRMYLDSTPVRPTYVYAVAGNDQTPFTRTIQMTPVMTTDGSKVKEMKVISTVTWRTGSLIAGQKVELVTYLENVYDTN